MQRQVLADLIESLELLGQVDEWLGTWQEPMAPQVLEHGRDVLARSREGSSLDQ